MNLDAASRIAAQPDFQDRVRLSTVKRAMYALGTATIGSNDYVLGQHVLAGTFELANWADAVVIDANVIGGAYAPDGRDITDTQVENAINAAWENFKK